MTNDKREWQRFAVLNSYVDFNGKNPVRLCVELDSRVTFNGEMFEVVEAAALQAAEREIAELKRDNICDACCGEGFALMGKCMCQGTGKMSEAAHYLRSELYKANERLEAVTKERDQALDEIEALLTAPDAQCFSEARVRANDFLAKHGRGNG